MQFVLDTTIRSLHWRVEPAILFDVIVLTRVELHLVISIISTKCVDATSEVDSCEECLLLRQVLSHFNRHIIVVKIVVLGAVSSDQVATIFRCDENVSEVARKGLSVTASASPLELNLLCCRLCIVVFLRVGVA